MALGASAIGASALAQGQNPPPAVAPQPQQLAADATVDFQNNLVIVPVGRVVRLRMTTKKPIANIALEQNNILDVIADNTDPTALLLRGRVQGLVRIRLTDAANAVEDYLVEIQPDLESFRVMIKRAVPTSNVIPLAGPSQVIVLTGNVARIDDVATIMQIAQVTFGTQLGFQSAGAGAPNIVNAMTVGGVHQVQLDVVVASVNRSEARRRGFDWGIPGRNAAATSIISGLATAAGIIVPAAGTPLTPLLVPNATANLQAILFPSSVQFLIQALRDERISSVLAEPKLVTLSGRPATFLSGGQAAVLSSQSGITGPGVAYQDIGVNLSFLPIVLGNGKIYLEVNPRVRNINTGLGITTTFGVTPGFDEQSVRTSVEMEPGQTLAIGGLISTNRQSSTLKVPVLGDLPFIGLAFSRADVQVTEQELVILVTPHLVDAQDCSQVTKRLPGRETREPDDFEFFLENVIEAPRGSRRPFENGRYKAPFKNDPYAGGFPCYQERGPQQVGGCANGTCGAPAAMTIAPGVVNTVPQAVPAVMPTAPMGDPIPAPGMRTPGENR